MNADKILPILCRYLKDTDNRLLATYRTTSQGLIVFYFHILKAIHNRQIGQI